MSFDSAGEPLRLQDVPIPEPGPGRGGRRGSIPRFSSIGFRPATRSLASRCTNAWVMLVSCGQADNIEQQPFRTNSGGRLNLRSTANLRTLAAYLEIITALHARYAGMSRAELAGARKQDVDRCLPVHP